MYLNSNGQLIDTNLESVNLTKAEELLHKFNLDWKVSKFPLNFNNGDTTHNTDFFGVVRTDNNDCFGAFTNQYETFQNSELAELVLEIADVIGQPISNGQEFKGGRKVMLQVNLEDKFVGDDTITRKATAVNSHVAS